MEPAAVAVRGKCERGTALHEHLALKIGAGRHVLTEEADEGGIVAEITVLLKESDSLIVVQIARHDVERDQRAGFFRNLEELFHVAFENE